MLVGGQLSVERREPILRCSVGGGRHRAMSPQHHRAGRCDEKRPKIAPIGADYEVARLTTRLLSARSRHSIRRSSSNGLWITPKALAWSARAHISSSGNAVMKTTGMQC